jgi:hypothetical protein
MPADIEIKEEERELRKYDSHVKPFLSDIMEWVKQGYTEESIVKHLGICYQTWIDYKKSQFELM